MRRILAALSVVCAATVTGGTPAQAITGDAVPDFEHPYVGVVILYDATGAAAQGCSGSLLTDTVFLTAGHCVTLGATGAPASSARVWFEQDAGADFDPATGTPASSGFPVSGGVTAGTIHRYGPGTPTPAEPYDAGLVILDAPVTGVYPDLTEYASLAGAGSLEKYVAAAPDGATTTISGYGASNPAGDPEQLVDERSRLMADTQIVGLNTPDTGAFSVALAGRQGSEGGGACFGDSGGPLLLAGTDVAAAVTSTGSPTCVGPFISYRTDTAPVLDWILASAGSEAAEIDIVDLALVS
jgi:hypothetical protein